MQIDGPQLPPEIAGSQSREVREVHQRRAEESGQRTEIQRDEATLSRDAYLLQRVREHLEGIPDVREDRVAALRQQILDGGYQVDLEAVINGLLDGRR